MMVAKKRPLPSRAFAILDLLDRQGARRFRQILDSLELKPSTLDRALKALEDELMIDATMVPESRRTGWFEYSINPRGKALLRSARAYQRALRREEDMLGNLVGRLDPMSQ